MLLPKKIKIKLLLSNGGSRVVHSREQSMRLLTVTHRKVSEGRISQILSGQLAGSRGRHVGWAP